MTTDKIIETLTILSLKEEISNLKKEKNLYKCKYNSLLNLIYERGLK